jgi:hypothetical protein
MKKQSTILTDDLERLCQKDVKQRRALEAIAGLDGIDTNTMQEIAKQVLLDIEKLMKPEGQR